MPYDPSHPIDLGAGESLPSGSVRWSFARSGGPGGQNVNKVATQATLIVALTEIEARLHPGAFRRFCQIADRYINSDNELVISSSDSRSQLDNRESAVRRLKTMVTSARRRPRQRKPTRPSRGSKERRLKNKKIRGETKARRGENLRKRL